MQSTLCKLFALSVARIVLFLGSFWIGGRGKMPLSIAIHKQINRLHSAMYWKLLLPLYRWAERLVRHFGKIEALCSLVIGNLRNFQRYEDGIMVLRVSRGLLSPYLYLRFSQDLQSRRGISAHASLIEYSNRSLRTEGSTKTIQLWKRFYAKEL